ncbi:MAG TPA: pantoate--beta-alanine ligase [bacterium]|nr:pantoate--beta-alanine ligase [bacterium]
MKVLAKPHEVQALAVQWRRKGRSIGFVPTMGALHEGHLQLVRRSRKESDITVVSIYVNPLQFGPHEDYQQYPRVFEQDLALLKKEKVDLVYHPTNHEMYPKGFHTTVEVDGSVVRGLCARVRPGHFNGVATVVVKLLGAVQPHRLYLGQKDAQQVAVLTRVLTDLDIPVLVVPCPIVRERDGLAMSSRNLRLSPVARGVAPVLYRALKVGKSIVDLGETDPKKVLAEVRKVIKDEKSVKLQYLEAVKLPDLEPADRIKPGTMIALAAYLDGVRLIDNILL